MRPFFLFSLLILTACGGHKHTSTNLGTTTTKELIQEKGAPESEVELPENQGTLVLYPEDEKYQSEDGIITTKFRNPNASEKILLYWKHKFKLCETKIKKLNAEESELSCKSKGQSVIYSEGSAFISRIVEYESK
ncbi:MAG TPA: hypothetical protein VNJ08_17430 [Bacteriovoracaceae bacterium]|nr:hypothetical protein [Bacteriovoracaceae bacterium]